jgi:hypothetical protein
MTRKKTKTEKGGMHTKPGAIFFILDLIYCKKVM